jgi:hypothetical protein
MDDQPMEMKTVPSHVVLLVYVDNVLLNDETVSYVRTKEENVSGIVNEDRNWHMHQAVARR